MIIAIPEYDSHPSDPAQWDAYYNTTDDNVYMQMVAATDPSYPDWQVIDVGASIRDSMRVDSTLIRTKYSGKDYQTYLDQNLAWLSEQYGDQFNDFMASDPAIMFAGQVSAALDQMSFSLDREADEQYITLARLRSNVSEEAVYLGYKSRGAVSGTTDELVTLDEGPYTFDVTLKKGHRFEGPNSLIFEVDTDQTIPAGDTSKLITIYQGQTFTEVFTSNGEANQRFNLSLIPSDRFLAQEKNFLTVDTVEWEEEEFLPYGEDESYEIHYLADPPYVKFGDGIVGKIPPDQSEIKITYVATAGKLAQLAISDTIQTNLTPVVVNFQQIPITVTNPSPVEGSDDAESLTSIKANAPRFYDAADRLVTKRDIEALASQFSDPLYGVVSKANALSIRGVEQDLELAALIAAVTADKDDLSSYMDSIRSNQNLIKGTTGSTSTADTIRYRTNSVTGKTDDVRTSVTAIDALVTTVKGNVEDAKDSIDRADSRLNFLPFHELLEQGDGSTTSFSGILAKVPIQEGSIAVFVQDKTPSATANDGDCDTTPGQLVSGTITFSTGDVGKAIRIGGEYRQILKRVSATTVEYTGPRIYGTGLIIEVYPAAVIGYDDGGGNISGTGVSSGTVNYTTGAWSIEFTTAPAGLSGQYGIPIVGTYQYKSEGIQAILTDATSDCDTAQTNTDVFSDHGSDISDTVDDVDTLAGNIDANCDSIDGYADLSITSIDLALVIPTQIETDLDALYEYLDTVISGECKANIVRVSCLVVDSNGFYAAPSMSLLNALQTYLDERKIETVRYSVVSGAFYLLKVNMTIELKASEQYLYSTVQQNVETAMDAHLKGRDYADPLLRSKYYKVAEDAEGTDYVNITISSVEWFDSANTGAVPTVDSDGNLFVDDFVAITKGTYTFVEIA